MRLVCGGCNHEPHWKVGVAFPRNGRFADAHFAVELAQLCTPGLLQIGAPTLMCYTCTLSIQTVQYDTTICQILKPCLTIVDTQLHWLVLHAGTTMRNVSVLCKTASVSFSLCLTLRLSSPEGGQERCSGITPLVCRTFQKLGLVAPSVRVYDSIGLSIVGAVVKGTTQMLPTTVGMHECRLEFIRQLLLMCDVETLQSIKSTLSVISSGDLQHTVRTYRAAQPMVRICALPKKGQHCISAKP